MRRRSVPIADEHARKRATEGVDTSDGVIELRVRFTRIDPSSAVLVDGNRTDVPE
jgi:hypothetical protein